MASSVDGCYRRDKELLYTIGKNHTTAYIGRSVREDELCNSFNSLDEELSASPNFVSEFANWLSLRPPNVVS